MNLDYANRTEPSISLCMIVKDEERFLEACLDSVKDCVHEMIIVDTGSTDRTVEIATSFGARVYHHPWENDFSKHRNQSIGYAKGDWILWMDADEQLETAGAQLLRKAITDPLADSLSATMVCYFDNRTRESWNNSVKLFKNGLDIHFEGLVHNQVVGCKNTRFCPAKIYHFGYDLDHKNVIKKFERTGNLLRKAIQADPHNYKHHHDLAVALSSVRRFREAIKEGLSAIGLHRKNNYSDPNILWTYFVVATSYFNLPMMDEARAIAEEALTIDPDHFDSYFVLASIHAARKNMKGFLSAYDHFNVLVTKYRRNPEMLAGLLANKINEKWRLDLDYGGFLLDGGLTQEAREKVETSASQAPVPSEAYRLANTICREKGFPELADAFLEKALVAGLAPQVVSLEKALNQRALGDLEGCSETLERLLDENELNAPEIMSVLGTEALKAGKFSQAEDLLTRASESAYVHPRLYTSLALACKYQDKIDEAVLWNQHALEVDEKDLDALTNLGHLFYDLKDWRSAETYYKRTLAMDGHQRDVLFRLSFLALINQDFDACITFCDRLMGELNLPRERVIAKMEDIAQIYDEIARSFSRSGQMQLHLEASTLSKALRGQ
ncbi:MAG: glycosyltransferase [Desulfobacteraceae bacterium]|nr:glycosyltransferase [Desulfobacteraceae bacterium]